MSTPAGDDLVGNASIRVDADTDPAMRALRQFSRDAQVRLSDLRGRFVAESALINRSLVTAAGGGDRFGLSLRSLADAARTAGGVLGRVGLGIAGLGASAGSAAPLLAGIVTTLESIAPAGAVAVTGMLAVTQAAAAIRLGMVGVEDAVTAAFDTSEAGAEKFDKALKKLAPNARAFVKNLAPELVKLQQGVQNTLFAGFDQILRDLSEHTLPILRRNLTETATTLNFMGQSVTDAALDLSLSGDFGKALDGANRGLSNLTQVPGQVVTALVQLAAAGAPVFARLTQGAADAATGISERLGKAFESGALERAINTAVDVLKDLGSVAANVFGILGNVIGPFQEEGGGFVNVLLEITRALRKATATEEFQDAISALGSVMGTLARTVGPLLGQALAAIGPVFTALGPPVERLIENLGAALSPIIEALGPVLAAWASAVGVIVDALSPLLPVVGELIASLLPPLVPAIQAIAQAWAGAAPIVAQLGQILTAVLAPIIAQLPTILTPLINTFTQVTAAVLPLVSQLLTALAPALTTLGQSFASLLVAVGPLLGVLGQLIGSHLSAIIPLLIPIITLVGQLASVLARQLASTINNLVVPALRFVTDLLRGDFTAAWNSLITLFIGVGKHIATTMNNIKTIIGGAIQAVIGIFQHLYDTLVGNSIIPDLIMGIVSWFARLPGMVFRALASLTGGLIRIATSALSRFRSAIVSGANATINFVRGVPGRIRAALSALAGFLSSVGRAAFAAFLSAVRSGASSVISLVRGIPGRIRGALGAVGSLLYSAGRSIIQGLINGIKSLAGNVKSAVSSVLSNARDLLPFSPAKEGPFSGKGWTLFSGRAISESLARGISQREPLVRRAARMVAESAQSAVSMPMQMAPVRDATFDAGIASQVGTVRGTDAGQRVTPVSITLHLTNQGVIGSPIELDAWLARSLDRLAQQRRLPASLRRAVA